MAISPISPGSSHQYLRSRPAKPSPPHYAIEATGFTRVRAATAPEPEAIDACFALHVIEHMQTAQAAVEFVTAIRDRMRPGGTLVIATPDFARWKTHFYDSDYTHVLPFTARRLRQLLQAADMSVVYESLYVGPVFGYLGVPFAWLASVLYTATVDDVLRKLVPRTSQVEGFSQFFPT